MNNKIKEMLNSIASKLEEIAKGSETSTEKLDRLVSFFGKIVESEEDTSELVCNFMDNDTFERVLNKRGGVSSITVPLSKDIYIEYMTNRFGLIDSIKIQLSKDICIDTRRCEVCYANNTDNYSVTIDADTAHTIFETFEFKSKAILEQEAIAFFRNMFRANKCF